MEEEITSQTIQNQIQLIKEWINMYQFSLSEEIETFNSSNQLQQYNEIKELKELLDEIERMNDYSMESYLDIQFQLKQTSLIPLRIKRMFNASQMDHYTMFLSTKYFETIEDFINLEMGVKRFNGNMTKFHYNPITLTPSTREFFTHLQTLYPYSNSDNQFENDKRIIARTKCSIEKYDLMIDQLKQLEEWSGKTFGNILFDSSKDDYSLNTSNFHRKVVGKENLMFLVSDTKGNKFGYYLASKIKPNTFNKWKKTTSNSFLFSLESNGRLNKMMKFEIKNTSNGYILCKQESKNLITLGGGRFFNGGIVLLKRNAEKQSFCFQHDEDFDYHGLQHVLVGNDEGYEFDLFDMKRLIVVECN